MKIKNSLLTIIVFLYAFPAWAQNIQWNMPVKITDRVFQNYVGTLDGYHYATGSNIKMTFDEGDTIFPPIAWKKLKLTLFRYDDTFNLKDTCSVRFFQYPLRVYTIDLSDSLLHIFYSKSTSNGISLNADVFNLNGFFKETKSLVTAENIPDFKQKWFFRISFSENKKYFVITTPDSIYCFNNKYLSQWKLAFSNITQEDGSVADDGSYYSIMNTTKGYTALAVTSDGKLYSQTLQTENFENSSFKIAANNKHIYIAALYGQTDRSFKQEYDQLANVPRFRSNGLQLWQFDHTLKNQVIKQILFSEETLLALVERVLLKNIKGVDFLKLTSLNVMQDDQIVALLVKEMQTPTRPKPVTGSKVDLPGRNTLSQDILLIRTLPDGSSRQWVEKRKTEASENFEYVTHIKGIPHKEDYYLYYQQGSDETNYVLTQSVFKGTLRKIFSKDINLNESKKPFPDLETVHKISDKRYVFFARIAKKFGSATLDFK
jgi:hypothetical protein